MMRLFAAALIALPLAAPAQGAAPTPEQAFFANLTALCGQSFAGKRISTDPQDAAFDDQPLVMRVANCTADEIRIPFSVGADHSRTWIVRLTPKGLSLKHDHRHTDGSEDSLSRYGGTADGTGSATRQQFPADAETKALFTAQNAIVSRTNVWALELHPEQTFLYELKRHNRDFRVAFDLARPIG